VLAKKYAARKELRGDVPVPERVEATR
jgi:hypothetical protein